VVSAISISVNAGMQLRRVADEKCPGKRREENGCDDNTRAIL